MRRLICLQLSILSSFVSFYNLLTVVLIAPSVKQQILTIFSIKLALNKTQLFPLKIYCFVKNICSRAEFQESKASKGFNNVCFAYLKFTRTRIYIRFQLATFQEARSYREQCVQYKMEPKLQQSYLKMQTFQMCKTSHANLSNNTKSQKHPYSPQGIRQSTKLTYGAVRKYSNPFQATQSGIRIHFSSLIQQGHKSSSKARKQQPRRVFRRKDGSTLILKEKQLFDIELLSRDDQTAKVENLSQMHPHNIVFKLGYRNIETSKQAACSAVTTRHIDVQQQSNKHVICLIRSTALRKTIILKDIDTLRCSTAKVYQKVLEAFRMPPHCKVSLSNQGQVLQSSESLSIDKVVTLDKGATQLIIELHVPTLLGGMNTSEESVDVVDANIVTDRQLNGKLFKNQIEPEPMIEETEHASKQQKLPEGVRQDDDTIDFGKLQKCLSLSSQSLSIDQLLTKMERADYERWQLGFQCNIQSFNQAWQNEKQTMDSCIDLHTDHEFFEFVEIQGGEPFIFARIEKHRPVKTDKDLKIVGQRSKIKNFRRNVPKIEERDLKGVQWIENLNLYKFSLENCSLDILQVIPVKNVKNCNLYKDFSNKSLIVGLESEVCWVSGAQKLELNFYNISSRKIESYPLDENSGLSQYWLSGTINKSGHRVVSQWPALLHLEGKRVIVSSRHVSNERPSLCFYSVENRHEFLKFTGATMLLHIIPINEWQKISPSSQEYQIYDRSMPENFADIEIIEQPEIKGFGSLQDRSNYSTQKEKVKYRCFIFSCPHFDIKSRSGEQMYGQYLKQEPQKEYVMPMAQSILLDLHGAMEGSEKVTLDLMQDLDLLRPQIENKTIEQVEDLLKKSKAASHRKW